MSLWQVPPLPQLFIEYFSRLGSGNRGRGVVPLPPPTHISMREEQLDRQVFSGLTAMGQVNMDRPTLENLALLRARANRVTLQEGVPTQSDVAAMLGLVVAVGAQNGIRLADLDLSKEAESEAHEQEARLG